MATKIYVMVNRTHKLLTAFRDHDQAKAECDEKNVAAFRRYFSLPHQTGFRAFCSNFRGLFDDEMSMQNAIDMIDTEKPGMADALLDDPYNDALAAVSDIVKGFDDDKFNKFIKLLTISYYKIEEVEVV